MYNFYKEIPQIIDNFDFDKIHEVMTMLEWRWYSIDRVPNVEELKGAAIQILCTCIGEFEKRGRPVQGMYVSTGGFTARIHCYESGDPDLQLGFYICESL